MELQGAIDILSRTVYGEARNQGDNGMAAVAWVVRNRADHPRWWGQDIASVCICPWQFSCWNKADPNRVIIQNIDERDSIFRTASEISRSVVEGRIADPTNGADSYFAVASDAPDWAASAIFTVKIGAHCFYRVELSEENKNNTVITNEMFDRADELNGEELQRIL